MGVGTMAMASAMDTAMDIPMATMATTERGVLRPSLRPRPIPTFCMADTTDMVSATATAMDTPTDTDTTARGVLMLILLLLPPLSATQSITYKTITPTVETNVVATNAAVPVAVGGYKAVAGDNGELKGAVHEVPAVFGA